MFAIYPGFEDLSLRVEVEWQGATRMVVARLEQWPDSDKAVLLCAFEDNADEGEWLLLVNNNIYAATRPDKWLKTVASGQGVSQRGRLDFRPPDAKKICGLIRRGFKGDSVARAFYFPALPDLPHVILHVDNFWCWCVHTTDATPFLFRINASNDNSPQTIEAQLQRAWDDETSDMHFVWKWFGTSADERYRKLTGFTGTWEEVKAIMEKILISATPLWQLESKAVWVFGDIFGSNFIGGNKPGRVETVEQQLQPWLDFLQSYFLPLYRADMREKYLCVSPEDPKNLEVGMIFINSHPTAHEQLEAKVALRDWLADKATPAVAAQLLASLES